MKNIVLKLPYSLLCSFFHSNANSYSQTSLTNNLQYSVQLIIKIYCFLTFSWVTSSEWTTTQKHYCTDLHYHRAMLGHPCKMWKSSHKSLICSRGWEPGKKQSQLWAIEKPEDRQEEAWRQTGRSLTLNSGDYDTNLHPSNST